MMKRELSTIKTHPQMPWGEAGGQGGRPGYRTSRSSQWISLLVPCTGTVFCPVAQQWLYQSLKIQDASTLVAQCCCSEPPPALLCPGMMRTKGSKTGTAGPLGLCSKTRSWCPGAPVAPHEWLYIRMFSLPCFSDCGSGGVRWAGSRLVPQRVPEHVCCGRGQRQRVQRKQTHFSALFTP